MILLFFAINFASLCKYTRGRRVKAAIYHYGIRPLVCETHAEQLVGNT